MIVALPDIGDYVFVPHARQPGLWVLRKVIERAGYGPEARLFVTRRAGALHARNYLTYWRWPKRSRRRAEGRGRR